MKRLIYSLIILFFLLFFSSCQLVLSTTTIEIVEEIPLNFIGFRVRYDGMTSSPNEENMDYYYIDRNQISPFFSNIIIEDYINEEGAHVHHIEVDLNIKSDDDKCLLLERMLKNDVGKIEYDSSTWVCGGVSMSIMKSHEIKSNDYNEIIEYKVNFVGINPLLEYTVTQFNQDNQKITQETLDLNESLHDIILNKNTVFIKILKKFNKDDEIQEERNLYMIEDFINQSFNDTVYTINQNNERTYIQFNFQIEE